jgi:hypothetical protein
MPPLTQRRDGGLDVVRARHRISAYIYGNITILAAVVAVDEESVENGHGLLTVSATALATFIAHITADIVSERVRPEHTPEKPRGEVLAELRDATPIATSAVVPFLLLLLGTLGVLSDPLAQLTAAAAIIVRLAGVGLITQRLSGRPRSVPAFWGGIALAVLSTAIAVTKALLTH